MEKQVAEYVALIERFFDFLEHHPVSENTAGELIILLMDLYARCLELPNIQDDVVQAGTGKEYKKPTIHVECPDNFWLIFYPFDIDDDSACAMISDNLKDICVDLLDGLEDYSQGRLSEAVLDWKCMMSHWGRHVVETLMALHSLSWGEARPEVIQKGHKWAHSNTII